jgi:hypothetical protein
MTPITRLAIMGISAFSRAAAHIHFTLSGYARTLHIDAEYSV